MSAFKLLRGVHVSGRGANRERFKQGDIVYSDIDLADRFGDEKFQKMLEAPTQPEPKRKSRGPRRKKATVGE